MKKAVLLIVMALTASAGPSSASAQIPSPRDSSSDEFSGFSQADFQRVLAQLKMEREALDADWRLLTKRLTTRTPTTEPDLEKLQEQLKTTLTRLQQERARSKSVSPAGPAQILAKIEQPSPASKKNPESEPFPSGVNGNSKTPESGAVDVLHLAQTLFRAERYEEALAAFRQVDLKGRRAEERAPIVYLTAICLHQVGKADEGITLLREAANSRGDERFAAYAQWQLENLRWHRETQGRLQDIRQRRLATEKR